MHLLWLVLRVEAEQYVYNIINSSYLEFTRCCFRLQSVFFLCFIKLSPVKGKFFHGSRSIMKNCSI